MKNLPVGKLSTGEKFLLQRVDELAFMPSLPSWVAHPIYAYLANLDYWLQDFAKGSSNIFVRHLLRLRHPSFHWCPDCFLDIFKLHWCYIARRLTVWTGKFLERAKRFTDLPETWQIFNTIFGSFLLLALLRTFSLVHLGIPITMDSLSIWHYHFLASKDPHINIARVMVGIILLVHVAQTVVNWIPKFRISRIGFRPVFVRSTQ